jgi:hypothetical protein
MDRNVGVTGHRAQVAFLGALAAVEAYRIGAFPDCVWPVCTDDLPENPRLEDR